MGMNDRGVPTSRTLLNRTWAVLIANAALIVAVMVGGIGGKLLPSQEGIVAGCV